MSTLKEFVESWNEYLPENRISDDEIKNVNESTFRYWLIIMLNHLKVETSCFEAMSQESSGIRLRSLRLKLISTINHFLSMNNNLMKLNYFDLITPNSKVVWKALNYLLNYVFYVNFIYDKTINKCAHLIKKRDELKIEKNQLLKDIERYKINEEKCVKTLRDFEKSIPQQKGTILTLQEKEKRLELKVKKIFEEIEKSDTKITELKAQIITISENIVNDEEAESIIASKKKLSDLLREQEEIIVASREKLNENSSTIERTAVLIEKMEYLFSVFKFDASDLNAMKKNFDSMKVRINKLHANISQHDSEIESLAQCIHLKKEMIEKLAEKKAELEKTIGSEDKANVQELKELTIELQKLSVKEDKLLDIKQSIKDEFNLLFTVASNVIKQLSANVFE